MLGCRWLGKQQLSESVNHARLRWPLGETGEALLEFRAGMSNGSNLTSHTPSRFYQHLCWSVATVRRINLLSWPLRCLGCMLKGGCAVIVSCSEMVRIIVKLCVKSFKNIRGSVGEPTLKTSLMELCLLCWQISIWWVRTWQQVLKFDDTAQISHAVHVSRPLHAHAHFSTV